MLQRSSESSWPLNCCMRRAEVSSKTGSNGFAHGSLATAQHALAMLCALKRSGCKQSSVSKVDMRPAQRCSTFSKLERLPVASLCSAVHKLKALNCVCLASINSTSSLIWWGPKPVKRSWYVTSRLSPISWPCDLFAHPFLFAWLPWFVLFVLVIVLELELCDPCDPKRSLPSQRPGEQYEAWPVPDPTAAAAACDTRPEWPRLGIPSLGGFAPSPESPEPLGGGLKRLHSAWRDMERDRLQSLLCELGHSKEQMPPGLAKNCYQCCSISATMISPACCACCQASDKAKHYMDSVEAEVYNIMWLSWWKACWLITHDYSLSLFCVFLRFCCGWSERFWIKTQGFMRLFGTNMSSWSDFWVQILSFWEGDSCCLEKSILRRTQFEPRLSGLHAALNGFLNAGCSWQLHGCIRICWNYTAFSMRRAPSRSWLRGPPRGPHKAARRSSLTSLTQQAGPNGPTASHRTQLRWQFNWIHRVSSPSASLGWDRLCEPAPF